MTGATIPPVDYDDEPLSNINWHLIGSLIITAVVLVATSVAVQPLWRRYRRRRALTLVASPPQLTCTGDAALAPPAPPADRFLVGHTLQIRVEVNGSAPRDAAPPAGDRLCLFLPGDSNAIPVTSVAVAKLPCVLSLGALARAGSYEVRYMDEHGAVLAALALEVAVPALAVPQKTDGVLFRAPVAVQFTAAVTHPRRDRLVLRRVGSRQGSTGVATAGAGGQSGGGGGEDGVRVADVEVPVASHGTVEFPDGGPEPG